LLGLATIDGWSIGIRWAAGAHPKAGMRGSWPVEGLALAAAFAAAFQTTSTDAGGLYGR
jgi:hypothetical protein